MKLPHITSIVVLAFCSGSAHAINKCVAKDGAVSYQQAPCADSSEAKSLSISVAPSTTTTKMQANDLPPHDCEDKEYLQLKDEAATAFGQEKLHREICLAAQTIFSVRASVSQVQKCSRVNEKLLEALNAAGDLEGASWALHGCKGDPPPFKKPVQK